MRTYFHVRPPLASQKPKPDSEAFIDDGLEVLEACKEGDVEKLSLLMGHKKYTANEYDKQNGATPLHWAVSCRDVMLRGSGLMGQSVSKGICK